MIIECRRIASRAVTLRTWGPIAAADACEKYEPSHGEALAASVQMTGAFGGAVAMQGSNDGASWVTLTDLAGQPVSMTAPGMAEMSTACRYIRPAPAAGVAAVTVTLSMRG